MAPLRAAFATALLLLLAGCSTPSDGTGSASVYVQDAPTDEFAEIHVVFTKVEVHASGDGEDDDGDGADGIDDIDVVADANATAGNSSASADANVTGNTTGPTASWKTLFEDASGVDVDLLNVTGAQAAFLGEADLAAGNYQQVRIHVTEAYGIDHNGSRVQITLSNEVLRTSKSFRVEADMETQVVVDIDLDRSLRENPNGWRMTPVIGKVTATVVEDEAAEPEAGEVGTVSA